MRENIAEIVTEVGKVLFGKEPEIKLAFACLLTRGHLLIEDLPGMGQTTLAHALAHVVGLRYQRVQFTNDMLPADILGVSVFDTNTNQFNFRPGPIFTQVLLADEINRTTPKTQSALLEAMEESQVTIDGNTRPLPAPFFVIATQNPQSQVGTFPLPESQLDRFLMRISLGYPDPEAEKILLEGGDPRSNISKLNVCLSTEGLEVIQQQAQLVGASSNLIEYVQRLIHETRTGNDFTYGLSPRGAMALLSSAKTWAYMHNRSYVIPEDVQAVLPVVVTHRITSSSIVENQTIATQHSAVTQLLARVDVVSS